MKLSITRKKHLENIAVEWRDHLGLKAFDPLPADRLAGELKAIILSPEKLKGISVFDLEQLIKNGNGWSACTISLKPLIIIYNSAHSKARYEADIMHELAHVILKQPLQVIDPETSFFLHNTEYEEEATYLGSCFQIPRRGLAWAIQKGMSLTEIATYFGASEEMVLFRCNMTGLHISQ